MRLWPPLSFEVWRQARESTVQSTTKMAAAQEVSMAATATTTGKDVSSKERQRTALKAFLAVLSAGFFKGTLCYISSI